MQKEDWWRGCVIYQIYPRSFMDKNGDGIGDLAGLYDRLEHVAKLGADSVWISPFFKSPMKDFGYDVSDYCDVDPIFGTLDDFRRVLDRAHTLGLKVLIDQVWSHTSDQHAWFKESRRDKTNPKHDWYVWADPKPDGTAPNNWLSYFGGPAWTWDARREQYYLHHFLSSQPAVNFWNPEVRAAIKKIAAFWLDMGVDGFRLDVAHTYLSDKLLRDNPVSKIGAPTDIPASNPMSRQEHLYTFNRPETLEWVEELAAFVRQWKDRCLLGEIGGADSEARVATYTSGGNRFQMGYSFGLLGSAMQKHEILQPVLRAEEVMGDGWICWCTSNHDFKRVASRIPGKAPLKDKALFASALGLSLRGSYCMYQGEELGLPQVELAFEDIVDPYDISLYPEHIGRDGCRTPMPWTSEAPHAGFSTAAKKTWLPVGATHLPLSVEMQECDRESTLSAIKNFLAWRKSSAPMRRGDFKTLDLPVESLFSFVRSHDGREITCIFNCADQPVRTETPLLKGKSLLPVSRHSRLDGENLLSIDPYGYVFFE